MLRTIIGIIVGILLFFPGIVLLQWLAVDVLGLYEKMTLTDGCLVYIIILLCILIVRGFSRGSGSARYPADLVMMGERVERERDRRNASRPPRPRRRGYDRD